MIKPLGARIVVSPLEAPAVTHGGIFIPSTAQDKGTPYRALVVAAGPGTKDAPVEVSQGDVVLVQAYQGTEVEFEGEKYKVVGFEFVLGVITEE